MKSESCIEKRLVTTCMNLAIWNITLMIWFVRAAVLHCTSHPTPYFTVCFCIFFYFHRIDPLSIIVLRASECHFSWLLSHIHYKNEYSTLSIMSRCRASFLLPSLPALYFTTLHLPQLSSVLPCTREGLNFKFIEIFLLSHTVLSKNFFHTLNLPGVWGDDLVT